MKNILYVCLGILFFIFLACDSYREIRIGDSVYQIPSKYLISTPWFFENLRLDQNDGMDMEALTFGEDQDFSTYMEPPAWLPGESVTVLMFSRQGTSYEERKVNLYPKDKMQFSLKDKELIEFEKIYRVFDKDAVSTWTAFPKQGAVFENETVEVKWKADCIVYGGGRGSDLSRVSMVVPTSCRVDIEYRNVILSIDTSEKNWVQDIDGLVALIVRKIESWRVPNALE